MAFRNNSGKTDSFFGRGVDEFILDIEEASLQLQNQLR
jgi:hypothetical protein